MPANITAGYHATSDYHSNPFFIPDATSAHSPLTHSDDVQVSNVVTPTEPPATALCQSRRLRSFFCAGKSGNVVSTNRNGDTLAYCTEESL